MTFGDSIEGYGPAVPFQPNGTSVHGKRQIPAPDRNNPSTPFVTLEEAVSACGLKDGATVSFHHHMRNGDAVLNLVLDALKEKGLKDLRVAASSIFPVHAPLAEKIRDKTVTGLWTDYMIGPVADAVENGQLETPAILQTHGGRARSICSGHLCIDAAFIAAPAADPLGNLSSKQGRAAFGPMGYPSVDADYARMTVAVVEELVEIPIEEPDIPSSRIDLVVKVPSIGDPSQIRSGTTAQSVDPENDQIAKTVAQAAWHAGIIENGFSFQTGAGGISLASVPHIGRLMQSENIRGAFISGGITGQHINLMQQSLFDRIHDVQSFDLDSASSYARNDWHTGMSADRYANPLHPDPIVDQLSLMVLGLVEIDRDFNINVAVSGKGRIIGGPGGHPDTAAGSKLTIAATKLTGGGFPKIVEKVKCVCTPGHDIDLLVTEAGIAVHPERLYLADRLQDGGMTVVSMDHLIELARSQAHYEATVHQGPPVGYVEYRNGTIIDRF